ncbi:hypothetical protein M413DRAFT_32217 [Hebeloma cylindrosporum]|uniref:F-box domain-containing protein n=1 Tax=Hebeloma cylindrosporum TaxID=76867 RepID=A0A0C2XCY0_HEBCY|nr:hypothetical protein M413DRAFT_32217 [Hebeloma cylindrosporum h7]
MPSQPTLPVEIIQMIIDSLAQDDPRFSTLKMFSLVCQCFLELCRKHIFASICLYSHRTGGPKPIDRLVRLLSTAPEIADHIRKIVWCIQEEDFEDPPLPKILDQFTKIESLTINWLCRGRRWGENSLRPTLLHLLQLSSLLRLELLRVPGFIFTDLIPCINLHEIVVQDTSARSMESAHTMPSHLPLGKPLQLHRLEFRDNAPATVLSMLGTSLRPDGRPVFDLAVLASISLSIGTCDAFEASRQIFQRCFQLTDVFISIMFCQPTWTGIAKMLNPSSETLARVHFVMSIDDAGDMRGLVAELEEMRHQNSIEKLTLSVSDTWAGECRFDQGDEWGRLDRTLTQPGWSKLENVTLSIFVSSDDKVDLASRAARLSQTQLQRLSSSSSIVFQFSVRCW